MKFGIMLPHSGALAGVENIRRVALEADDLGFDSVWCHDHVTYDTDWFLHRGSGLIEQCEGIDPDFYESISTLTWVAGMTSNVKLGTAILVLPLAGPKGAGPAGHDLAVALRGKADAGGRDRRLPKRL